MTGGPLLTVGHGTLDGDAFLDVLRAGGVAGIVDVRRFPGSRRHPQFGSEALAASLAAAGIGYRWDERLGGRRRVAPDSPNVAWRNESFRAYADHMASGEFRAALDEVLADADERSTAVLCSESVWWRCHRRLVADAGVLLHGREVRHLFHDGRAEPHRPTPEARVDGAAGVLVYDVGVDRPLG